MLIWIIQVQIHGIHKIILSLSNKTISNVEKVEIGISKNKEIENLDEIEHLKEEISKEYEISKDIIYIKLK